MACSRACAVRCIASLATLVVLLAFATRAPAQTDLGSIAGTVTDRNGGVVPGATVTVTQKATNHVLTVVTSDAGLYSASALHPGLYLVVVEVPGFKKAVMDNVRADTARRTTADFRLELGAPNVTVSVTAEAPLLTDDSGASQQVITEEQIVDLPLSHANLLELALTVPNVSGEAGSEEPGVLTDIPAPGAGLNINGGRAGTAALLADGVVNSGAGLGRSVVGFTPDTVQQFSVQSTAYSAEYGFAGGVINVTTKSGQNEYRGLAYWYNRNPIFNAAPYTIATRNRPRSEFRLNNFGLTFGGPITVPRLYNGRNRSFFFVGLEPRFNSDKLPIDALLPTEAMRGGDFRDVVSVPGGFTSRQLAEQFGIPVSSDIVLYRQFNLVGHQLQRFTIPAGTSYAQFEDNVIPSSYLDPVAQRILKFLPAPTAYFIATNGQLRNYASTRYVRTGGYPLTLRFDQHLGRRNKLWTRFSSTQFTGERGRSEMPENALIGDYSYGKQFTIADTHVFTPRVIHTLQLNYTRGNFSRINPLEFHTRNVSTELGLPSGTAGGLPRFDPGVGFVIGQSNIGDIRNVIDETFQITQGLTWTWGKRIFKLGADLRHLRLKTQRVAEYSGGSYGFNGFLTNNNGQTSGGSGGLAFATFLLGIPSGTSSGVTLRNADIPYYYRWNSAALYLQNDWRSRPNLTLNLGVRYSLQIPRIEKYDRQGYLAPELATEVSLPAPLRILPDTVVTSTLVPPFLFAGRGGRSRTLLPVNKNNFEPRFGFAWRPLLRRGASRHARSFAVRGGYALSYLALTGLNRDAFPDFGLPGTIYNWNAGQQDPEYIMRLGSNPPHLPIRPFEELLRIPEDGIVGMGSLAFQGSGFAIDPDARVPYVQNWNFTLAYELTRETVLEAAYVGSKGTHLFNPPLNINPRPFEVNEHIIDAGIDPNSTITDPLRRRNLNGGLISVTRGSMLAPFGGFNILPLAWDSSVNSIRHAGYVRVQKRYSKGLAFTASYTFGKSIDEASDSGGTISSVTIVQGTRTQVNFGGMRRDERSVSSFDVTHSLSSTFNWQLPIGRRRRFLGNTRGPLGALVSEWNLTGIFRLMSGYPFQPRLSDDNRMGNIGTGGGVRPMLVAGVPLINPHYSKDCPVSSLCEPYFNPSAFVRPPKGELGNAPRTLSAARGPRREYFDLSVQKNFRVLGGERSRYLQLRADFYNVLNHPNQIIGTGSYTLVGFPSEALITIAEYNGWARSNGKPLADTAEGMAVYNQAREIILQSRIPRRTVLPADFWAVPLPDHFRSTPANAFDITTLDGYKLWRLRQAYSANFGTFDPARAGSPRTIQFALRLYF